jgi:hypothetical protein
MKTTILKNAKKIAFTALGVALLATTSATAQEETTKGVDLSLTLVSDTFFGFAPMVSGSYNVGDGTDFTFYSIFWGGGTAQAWGNWAEFGVGLDFEVEEGLNVNPSIGFTSGNLLSSYTSAPSIFGEGIVPNVVVGLDKDQVEGELYFGYYAPLRAAGPVTASYIHYWTNLGYKASSLVSLGGHFEQLYGGPKDGEGNVYMWLGAYAQVTDPAGKGFLRVTGGHDFDSTGSFYKISAGFNF